MKIKTFFLTIFICLSSIVSIYPQDLKTPYYLSPRGGEQHIDLSENWELNYTDEAIQSLNGLPVNDWVTADEPTSVQMAWFKAGKLPDPYAHLNAEKYTWMEEKVWYYRKTVNIPEHAKIGYVFLAFDGIDYFSRIWFNGKLLGSHEGMWGGPMIYIGKHLQPGQGNEIIVEVKSGNYNQWDTFDWRNPGTIIKTRTFAGGSSHKPFFALGMWRGARIEMVPQIHMERPFLQTKKVSEDVAKLHLSVELFVNSHSLEHQLHPWHETQISNYSNIKLAPDKEIIPEELELQIEFKISGNVEFSEKMEVLSLKGRSWIEEEILLHNPKLWYPNGLGNPNMYNVKLSLLKNGKTIDDISFNYGIRTIEQVPSAGPRTGDRWKKWQFVVNNKEFFVKGINWMPSDPLYDFPKEKYEWLIHTAAKAGIQMIRIWGGGLFETEEFYDACNRHGIMVWQDFPKNNNVTPDWPQDTWEANVVQNIIRLRNHPSLAVWCGGNEFNPYAKQNATTLNILERSLDDFDPTRLWLRTSPDHGSTHLYPDFDPVWYKKELNIVPYIAETGIHSIPEAISLYEVVEESEFQNLGDMYNEGFAENHPEFIYHFMEYSPGRVPRMLSRASHINDMSNPTLESMSEATQIGAGEFYQVMSDGIQSNYPVTTGLMPWVFKRPWPTVAAIHLLDGFGQPSAPYYFLKRTYEQMHVVLLPERMLWKTGETFPVRTAIINSSTGKSAQNTHYFLSVKIMDEQFNEVYHQTKPTQLKPGPSVNEISFGAFNIPGHYKNRYFFIYVSLHDQAKNEISRSVYWPRTIPQMENDEYYDTFISKPQAWPTLKDGPWLKPVVNKTKTSLDARIISKKHLENGYTNVLIEIENDGRVPSFMTKLNVLGNKRLFVADDNFFWMQPGEKRQVQVVIKWREKPDKNNSIIVESWNAKKQEIKF